jgi:hypothetical protein
MTPFLSRFYLVDESGEPPRVAGKKSSLREQISFFFLGSHVASTLAGARTLAIVRTGSVTVGQWVTPILRQERGAALEHKVELLLVDIANPARRTVLFGYTSLDSESGDESTFVDGTRVRTGAHRIDAEGDILQRLLERAMEDRSTKQ